jgi:hypothetical protein
METDYTEARTRDWPVLHAAQDLDCDGENPLTGRSCVLGHHRGRHRDEAGAHWLDGEEDDDPRHT